MGLLYCTLHCTTWCSSIALVAQIHTLSYEELQQRIAELDPEMEREIEELQKRYQAKRQPIIDAIDAKKRRLQKY